jgi:pimeloyl-ACP methyl ester carboxylesterase
MLAHFMPMDYLPTLADLKQPTAAVIGDADELSVAAEVVRAVHGLRGDVPVRVLPGIRHLGLVTNPAAITAVSE